MLRDDLIGEVKHLCRSGRVERGGMLVEQQQLRLLQGSHQQCDGLTLAAGEKADSRSHPILQTETESFQAFAVFHTLFFGHTPAETAFLTAAFRKGEVFLQLHVRGRAHHRILKHTPDQKGSLMLGQSGDVVPVQNDAALVNGPDTGNGVEHGGLSRTVSADDGDKITGIQMERELVQRAFLVDGAGVEGLADLEQVKHGSSPPSV